jgi:hypothetical protein
MIVFDLACANGHRFEGWFTSSEDFARQKDRDLVACPQCDCIDVEKAPMAPAVPRKGNRAVENTLAARQTPPVQGVSNAPMPPEVVQALAKLAEVQARALKDSTWVGKKFAEDARAMHYGEQDAAPIHGEATPAEAQRLLDEGIEIAPLPFPVAPPKALN